MAVKIEHAIAFGAVGLGVYFMWKKRAQQKAEEKASTLAWPVECRVISSKFGSRDAPLAGASTYHNGIDIACPELSYVYAPADGVVKDVWFDVTYGGGQSLSIEHADGLRTGYCHLSAVAVKKGDKVTRGQNVAQSGGVPGTYGAGNSTGAHLHFTCKIDGVAVDPETLLA